MSTWYVKARVRRVISATFAGIDVCLTVSPANEAFLACKRQPQSLNFFKDSAKTCIASDLNCLSFDFAIVHTFHWQLCFHPTRMLFALPSAPKVDYAHALTAECSTLSISLHLRSYTMYAVHVLLVCLLLYVNVSWAYSVRGLNEASASHTMAKRRTQLSMIMPQCVGRQI